MSKIHVLLANDHLGIRNSIHGVGRLFSLWAPRFDKSKFEVTICILRARDKLGERLEEEFHRAGVEIRFFERGKFNPFTLLDFLRVVREKKIDIMHLQAYGATTFGRLAGIVAGVPRIVHVHDDASQYPWYQKLADLFLSRFTDAAIAVSESVKDACTGKRRIPRDRLMVMHNGVPLESFRVPRTDEINAEKRRLGIAADHKVIGTVGKLRREKGLEFLLRSGRKTLQAVPKTYFLLVGDGPLRGELEDLTRELEIEDKVIFAGFRQNPSVMLSLMDIYAMPSLTEGSPLALLEAMAMGRPIVASKVGGLKEILDDGETGLLVAPEDSVALAEKLIYLLKNEDKAERLGMRAKEESKKYDLNLYVRRLEELYWQFASRS